MLSTFSKVQKSPTSTGWCKRQWRKGS